MNADLESRARWLLSQLPIAGPADSKKIDAVCDLSIDLSDQGRSDLALPLLQRLTQTNQTVAKAWQLLALAQRDLQDHLAAWASIERAAYYAPADPLIAMASAQIALELGRPAAALFASVRRQQPNHLGLAQSYAAALSLEGRGIEALQFLTQMLTACPDWIDGHRSFAAQATALGEPERVPAQFLQAHTQIPHHLNLMLVWYQFHAARREWAQARHVIEMARKHHNNLDVLNVAEAYINGESGSARDDPDLFDAVSHVDDATLDLYKVRHFLRLGNAELAESIALKRVGSGRNNEFWPYLSTAWRMMANERWKWLDGEPLFIREINLALTADDLEALAGRLRRLHVLKHAFDGQSVRGGTQTDGPLLFRGEPEIIRLRHALRDAVDSYVRSLPPHQHGHPLLAKPRNHWLFEGSWSVRLTGGGHHAVHTHTHGWISSAAYIVLPCEEKGGGDKAGWLEFGAPPPELDLDIGSYAQVRPTVGKIALFPSTMWHGTVPFEHGERMTVAFDVRAVR